MAVTLDIGNNQNIHPANKKDVGERLALWALAKDYNKDIVFPGPIYKSMTISGNKIKVEFDYVADGLRLTNENESGFMIAGENRKFLPAKVKIGGHSLIVWAEAINDPVAVRYAWSNTAMATLFNKNGLPSSSFCTDNWGIDH
jgi:sialate O-acetylesterase